MANVTTSPRSTGSDAVGAFLVDTGGNTSANVAGRIRRQLGPARHVTDLEHTRAAGRIEPDRRRPGRSDPRRTRLRVGARAPRAGGLVLWLGFAERRRTFAIATALGAAPANSARSSGREADRVASAALLSARPRRGAVAHARPVLTGVFDPPPDTSRCRGPTWPSPCSSAVGATASPGRCVRGACVAPTCRSRSSASCEREPQVTGR